MLSQLHIQFTLFLFLFHIVSFLLDTRVPAVLSCYWSYTRSSVGSHMEDMMEKCCLQGLDTTFHFIICKSTYLLVSVIKSFNSIFYFWHKSCSLFDWNLIASFPIHFSSLPTSFSTFTFSTFLHTLFDVYDILKFNNVHTFNQRFCLFASCSEIELQIYKI